MPLSSSQVSSVLARAVVYGSPFAWISIVRPLATSFMFRLYLIWALSASLALRSSGPDRLTTTRSPPSPDLIDSIVVPSGRLEVTASFRVAVGGLSSRSSTVCAKLSVVFSRSRTRSTTSRSWRLRLR